MFQHYSAYWKLNQLMNLKKNSNLKCEKNTFLRNYDYNNFYMELTMVFNFYLFYIKQRAISKSDGFEQKPYMLKRIKKNMT